VTEPGVIVEERRYQVNFLWGFLTIVSAIVLWRAHTGMSGVGRIVADVIVGAFVLLFAWAWVWFVRHPAHLEVTPEEIRFQHKGQRKFSTLPHTGALYVKRTLIGGKHPVAFLKVKGSDDGIALGSFDLSAIKEAAYANGWRFTGDEGVRGSEAE
jgi:hypothetical protein